MLENCPLIGQFFCALWVKNFQMPVETDRTGFVLCVLLAVGLKLGSIHRQNAFSVLTPYHGKIN